MWNQLDFLNLAIQSPISYFFSKYYADVKSTEIPINSIKIYSTLLLAYLIVCSTAFFLYFSGSIIISDAIVLSKALAELGVISKSINFLRILLIVY